MKNRKNKTYKKGKNAREIKQNDIFKICKILQ